ncbi:MAG: tetratricopeptide repeat protein [Candidatus Eremiobacteraeota bacterium]|nr:tetratricopeptide repeat protein [Candidatus Eremiobacteraeota bacterium]
MDPRTDSGRPACLQQPSGIVAFAFSDIEGSTQRWESHRAAMQDAVRRHDAIMRGAITEHGGYVFKTVGDAFCSCFARPHDAVVAMLAAQRALAAEDFSDVEGIRVRMAIHAGTADERDGDYFGPAVNHVARLLALAHGGQVVLSGTTADLLHEEMPAQTSLRDLGEHRLKDLSRAQTVFQLVAPGLPEMFPPLRSLDALPNNLPRQLSSFVGRDDVVAEVAALLGDAALVSLVGPGGAGKTRCAIQVGAEVLDDFPDGAWLVELARISDPQLVAATAAKVLGVEEVPTRPIVETLLPFLKRKRLLLILDNCEHVIAEARAFVSTILIECPDVRVLVTSRESLNITGEDVYRMPSLPVPPAEAAGAEEIVRFASVTLFVDRARSVEKRFALDDANARAVAEICRRLDGIPLAIELAAARVKMLTAQELCRRLSDRFQLLTAGDRNALPRQRTMRALIDWSYDLLPEEDRTLFRRLAIFAGGFTLDLVTRVCSDATLAAGDMLDLLTSLVDKSLVQADPGSSATRYRLLESTRQYAREKLVAAGEFESLARAHAVAFCEFGEMLERTWHTTPSPQWLALSTPELENWRSALEWALDGRHDVLLGQRLAALSVVAFVTALAEGRRWVHAAQQSVDASTPPAVIAALDLAEAFIDWRFDLHKASYAAAERALPRVRAMGNPLFTAWTLRIAGNALVMLGRPAEGTPMLQEALTIGRAAGMTKLSGWILEALATASYVSDDIDAARSCSAEALKIARQHGHWQLAATVSLILAKAEYRAGDATTALRLAGEALDAYAEWHEAPSIASTRSDIAAYLVALDRYDEALTHVREAIAPLRDAQRDVCLAFTLQHLAAILALRPAPSGGREPAERAEAARLLGYVEARVRALEGSRENAEQREYERTLARLTTELGAQHLERLREEGAAWNEERAVTCAFHDDPVLAA